jgi:hypothetical protein
MSKKSYLVISMVLLVTFSAFAQTKRAFVMTIGDYPAQYGWGDLSSSNDKAIVTDLLLSQGFEASNIVTLSEQDATYAGFKKAMTDFTSTLTPGDIVYFHYSGHGQQVMDIPAAEVKTEYLTQDEPDGYDEALVLYNAPQKWVGNYQFQEHLVDDQINFYFNEIRKRIGGSGQLMAVFDSCHSGTVSRGSNDWVVRGTSIACAPENYKPTAANVDESNSDFAFDNKAEMGKLVCFFGCRPEQVNREMDRAGSLTTFLAGAVKELKENATYNNLFSLINEKMAVNFQNAQHPDVEGDDLNQLLFSGKLIVQDPFVQCEKLSGDKAYLNGGIIHGLAIGDSIGFFSNTTNTIKGNTPLLRGVVTEVEALKSTVMLKDKKNDRGEKYRAFVISKAVAPASLDVLLDAGALNNELKKILHDKKNIQLVEGKAKYVIKQYHGEGNSSNSMVQIIVGDGPNGMPLRDMNGLDISNDEGKQSLVLFLAQAARSEVLRELEWYDESFNVKFTATKKVLIKGKPPVDSNNSDVSYVDCSNNEGYEFLFTNEGTDPVVLNIIYLDPNGNMGWDSKTGNRLIKGMNSLSLRVSPTPPYGLELMKIIYSKENIDFSAINELGKSLATRGGETPLLNILGKASEGTRGATDFSTGISIENFTFNIIE